MFDLEREVDAWSAKAFAGPCHAKAATRAELRDHLHCEIERLEAEGRSREEAFRVATAALEGTVAGVARSAGHPALRRARLAHAILWAALILATSIVLAKRDDGDELGLLLIIVFIPSWYASDLLLARLWRGSGRS